MRVEAIMETQTSEASKQTTPSSDSVENSHEDLQHTLPSHEEVDIKLEIAEVRSILEVMAATGKYWHDWQKLKSMLSHHLKQVLADYPESKMPIDQQNSTLGETYLSLERRLDDALCSFVAGPPFTLQRLSEIILNARSMYPNLSKLALALEKNLLVTSTLMASSDPCPPAMVKPPIEPDRGTEDDQPQANLIPNGVSVVADRDEIMAEGEPDIDDMTIDTDVGLPETRSTSTSDS